MFDKCVNVTQVKESSHSHMYAIHISKAAFPQQEPFPGIRVFIGGPFLIPYVLTAGTREFGDSSAPKRSSVERSHF